MGKPGISSKFVASLINKKVHFLSFLCQGYEGREWLLRDGIGDIDLLPKRRKSKAIGLEIPFHLQITASVRERPLRATWAPQKQGQWPRNAWERPLKRGCFITYQGQAAKRVRYRKKRPSGFFCGYVSWSDFFIGSLFRVWRIAFFAEFYQYNLLLERMLDKGA